MPKRIPLSTWLANIYGDTISINTARRWVRDGKIQPQPELVGREYYCDPAARYNNGKATSPTLVERMIGSQAAQQ